MATKHVGTGIRSFHLGLGFIPGSRHFPLQVHRFVCWVNRVWPAERCLLIRLGLMGLYHLGAQISVVTRKIQIEENTLLGENICLSPRGRLIIGAEELGHNCVIGDAVTIGWGFGAGREMGRPVIGDNVLIESNSLIYGNIRVGNGTIIREGTILSKSVPDRCVVQGNPGRVVTRNHDNTDMLRSARRALCGKS